MENPPIFKNGKPSISIRAIYTMAILNYQRVYDVKNKVLDAEKSQQNNHHEKSLIMKSQRIALSLQKRDVFFRLPSLPSCQSHLPR